jgi:hypothetical protein
VQLAWARGIRIATCACKRRLFEKYTTDDDVNDVPVSVADIRIRRAAIADRRREAATRRSASRSLFKDVAE